MRGIGHTLSRLPQVRAFFVGAAILAGAFTSSAHGQMSGSGNGNGTIAADATPPEEAAWAVPRVSHPGAAEVAFPQPLRPSDVALVRQIFAFQSRGDIPAAIRSAAALEEPVLLGTILSDRYLGRWHHSTVEELSDWLARYGDQPEAAAIHALLLTRLPKGSTPPPAPETVAFSHSGGASPVLEDIDPRRTDLLRDPVLDRSVSERAQRGNTASALRLITTSRGISAGYAAQLRAEVADILFIRNEDAEAVRVADLALTDVAAMDQPGLAFYAGGLAAWRLGRFDQAWTLFEGGANAVTASVRLRAASAFWAARAARVQHDADATVRWLHVAAEQRLTLHGMLARRILRMNTGIMPSDEVLAQADVDAVAATPRGWRGFALLQVGQSGRAEAEFRGLWSMARADPVFGRSLLMVASATGLTEMATQMVSWLEAQDGHRHDELGFTVPRLRPASGFSMDPTMVYALARVESNFNTEAVSAAGARGLMQIMPATAQYLTGESMFEPDRLHDPAWNLDIGQRYVAYLAKHDGIDNDLLRVLASYNSGPGNVSRWSAYLHDQGDPLLFIEAIPITETRAFVQHALLYSWIYAARMHLPAPSLDALAAGEFPRFTQAGAERKMKLVTPEVH